jgi:hypothetical protein
VLESFAGDEYKFVLPYGFDVVAYDPTHPGAIADEVEFILMMPVQGVVEFILVPLYDVEAIFVGKAGDFG